VDSTAPSAARPRWLEYVGLGYVLLALLVTLNIALVAWGPPAPRLVELIVGEGRPPGAGGLAALGWVGTAVIALVVWRGELNGWQAGLVAAVAAWIGSAAVSMSIHGLMQDVRYWAVAVGSVAVAAAGALISFTQLRRLMLGLGWFYGWGSVLVGLSDLLIGWPVVLVPGDPRYGRWLSMLGVDVGDVASLNGVTPGRVYVGLTCAVLLVFAVRAVPGRWTWVMSVGLVAATLWSFSRTGMVAMIVGVLVTLIPFERAKRIWWPLTGLLGFMLLPLVLSGWLRGSSISDGTTVWRFDLWQRYLADSEVWMPFGIGPKPASPEYAGHAHQQLLESLAVGGWLGLAGCVAFIVLATWVAVRVAALDNRAAVGVLFVMAVIFQVDVVTFSAAYAALNNAYILIVVVILSTAGLAAARGRVASA
jgi:hypothetical protein